MSSVLTVFVNQSSTKSVILSTMSEEVSREFLEWFNSELKKKNLGITSAARFIDVSHPTLLETVTNHKKPSCETCFKIADAFGVTREFVLRKAGWLKPTTESDDIIEQILLDMGAIPIEAKRTAARMVRAVREEVEEYRTH